MAERETTVSVTPEVPETSQQRIIKLARGFDALDREWRLASQVGQVPVVTR